MRDDIMLGLFVTAFIIGIAFVVKKFAQKTYQVTL